MENLELSQEFTGSYMISTTSSRSDILDVVTEQIGNRHEEICDKYPDVTELESILIPLLTDKVCQEFMNEICILEANADHAGFDKLYRKLTDELLKLAKLIN